MFSKIKHVTKKVLRWVCFFSVTYKLDVLKQQSNYYKLFQPRKVVVKTMEGNLSC